MVHSAVLPSPPTDDIDVVDVMHALADPTRLTIVRQLLEGGEQACGGFDVRVSASTLSHHFKVLREAGVIDQREQGRHRMTSLRSTDLETRFPGLLTSVFGVVHA
ncbi:ArsR/SmtB family transcription factor [Myceligenerans indicum]|uniref:Helix-turn-helix transcriptional regulator n=1 Tax=Myceligenerans indicum TaxID=2593663 RepID=A0ABS1LQ90_9MICO|nr:helix-turn-helix transcriptional regulator [Myceligenerans indicum]MBL0888360.1 helix-turn-helix transcriptional regulator [Myceligenerans indicum]